MSEPSLEKASADLRAVQAQLQTITTSSATPTPAPIEANQRFFGEIYDRLMMAHALVQFRELRVDPDKSGLIILSDKNIAKTREAAGVLLYADDGREWSLAGSGNDGDQGLYCTILRVNPYPASQGASS